MDTTITIRKAESTDIPAIKMLWQFYQYHQSIFDLEDVGLDGCYKGLNRTATLIVK